jgi:hypothetical protein
MDPDEGVLTKSLGELAQARGDQVATLARDDADVVVLRLEASRAPATAAMASATTHTAPAMARFTAFPAQR